MKRIPMLALLLSLSWLTACSSGPSEPPTPELMGVALDHPALIKDAVAALNALVIELLPDETDKHEPTLPESQVEVIVDFDKFLSGLGRKFRGQLNENTIAFVARGSETIWVNWTNDDVRELNERYRHGQPQPVYVMASFLAHELGHVALPCDQFAAHTLQLLIIQEFEKRGKIAGYEQYMKIARDQANVPHSNFVPCPSQ